MVCETIYLRTLTPLWTGDIDRTSAQVRETGLIGSLRWWYEGLVRSFGGYACDPRPKSPHRCELSGREKTDEERRTKMCAACYLFGCTGWSRRFRLEVDDLKPLPLFFMSYRTVYVTNGNWLVRLYGGRPEKSRPPRFHFNGVQTLWGQRFAVRIVPVRGNSQDIYDQLVYLLNLISTWGALGAKTQNGFGQVQPLDALSENSSARGRNLVAEHARRFMTRQNDVDHFRFDRFFSRVYEIKDPAPYSGMELIGQPPNGFDCKAHFIPCAFDIRYKSRTRNPRTGQGQNFGLRPFFREHFGQQVTSALFGETRAVKDNDRSASRIHVSHLYKETAHTPFKLKIWGWVPPNLEAKGKALITEDVVSAIDEFISSQKGMFPGSQVSRRFEFEKELK